MFFQETKGKPSAFWGVRGFLPPADAGSARFALRAAARREVRLRRRGRHSARPNLGSLSICQCTTCVWLKIKRSEGLITQVVFRPCVHLPGQPILEFRFFEPQPYMNTHTHMMIIILITRIIMISLSMITIITIALLPMHIITIICPNTYAYCNAYTNLIMLIIISVIHMYHVFLWFIQSMTNDYCSY